MPAAAAVDHIGSANALCQNFHATMSLLITLDRIADQNGDVARYDTITGLDQKGSHATVTIAISPKEVSRLMTDPDRCLVLFALNMSEVNDLIEVIKNESNTSTESDDA